MFAAHLAFLFFAPSLQTGSKFACVPAGLLCWSGFGQLQDLGLNMYDTRRKCNRDENEDGVSTPSTARVRQERTALTPIFCLASPCATARWVGSKPT